MSLTPRYCTITAKHVVDIPPLAGEALFHSTKPHFKISTEAPPGKGFGTGEK